MMDDLNIMDVKRLNLSYYLFQLPGFNNTSVMKKILAAGGYLFLIETILTSELSDNNRVLMGLELWLNRITYLIVCFTVILFAGNYLNIHGSCFFSQSTNPKIKKAGIVLTALIWICLEMMILMLITSLLKLN